MSSQLLRRATNELPSKVSVEKVLPAVSRDRSDTNGNARHSLDYRSVLWYGSTYTFTPMQAACIKVLWEHWEQGTPTVGEQTILEVADSSSNRLRDVFGKGKHPTWGTLIVKSGKGAFRLNEPGPTKT